jgi:hypothetical protein
VSPLLPTNANGTIKTTAVSWEFTFTEEHVIPDSFEITYTALADRKPFCAMVLWRQQDDNGIGIIRTAEVRYAGTAEDGPYEQHDLSSFCASENHAVKVGAYIISKRKHVTHRLQLGVKPDAFNATLNPGDLVRVRLERVASTGASSLHDYLYEVDRIGKSIAGDVRLELTHFPVDANYASVVAQEVNAATGTGILLPTGLSGVTCDVNSSADTSVPADTSVDTWVLPDLEAFDFQLSGFGASGLNDPPVDNPAESSSTGAGSITGGTGANGNAISGDVLNFDPGCPGAYIEWRLIDNATGEITVAAFGVAAPYIAGSVTGKSVVGVGKCPDPSSPTGYGPEIVSPPITITDPLGWNQLSSTGGTLVIYYRIDTTYTNRIQCSTGLPATPLSPTVDFSPVATLYNVVAYRYLRLEPAIVNYVCSPQGLYAPYVSFGIEYRYANGTTTSYPQWDKLHGTISVNQNGYSRVDTATFSMITLTFNGVSLL